MTHARLEASLADTDVPLPASELDGLVAGYACGHGDAEGDQLPEALQVECEDADTRALLARMHRTCRERLAAALDMQLEPLLPDDGRPLRERVDALVEWTRGFLGGFGLAGADSGALSDDGREVLHDLGTLAGSEPTLNADTDSNEDDESALMELTEFVRVGAALLHTEMAMSGTPARGSLH